MLCMQFKAFLSLWVHQTAGFKHEVEKNALELWMRWSVTSENTFKRRLNSWQIITLACDMLLRRSAKITSSWPVYNGDNISESVDLYLLGTCCWWHGHVCRLNIKQFWFDSDPRVEIERIYICDDYKMRSNYCGCCDSAGDPSQYSLHIR